MPWLVELSKKYLELGLDIAYKCAVDEKLLISILKQNII